MYIPVSVFQNEKCRYCGSEENFRPSESYPEYIFKEDIARNINEVYATVRECFRLTGLDCENYGTYKWNPLKQYVKSGDNVVIKPNMVMHKNQSGDGEECLYTQPSVVAAVIDYVLIALNGNGKIIVGDAPMQECDFEKLISTSGYKTMIEFYKNKGVDIELVDFRELKSSVINGIHHYSIENNVRGRIIDLADNSDFAIYDKKHISDLRITNYNPEILNCHHTEQKHEYCVSQHILNADVIINMPKPKTHRKAGVTISLKNMIGTCVRKEYLPHHCLGELKSGGDEYARRSFIRRTIAKLLDEKNRHVAAEKYMTAKILSILIMVLAKINSYVNKDQFSEGSWYGNNTISKTIDDINKIIFYADKHGHMTQTKQREMFIVADLIIAGEGEGPILPTGKKVGIVAMGDDQVCFDEALATLMGMDITKIPTLQQVRKNSNIQIAKNNEKPIIISNVQSWNKKKLSEIKWKDTLQFKPTFGWAGHIEIEE